MSKSVKISGTRKLGVSASAVFQFPYVAIRLGLKIYIYIIYNIPLRCSWLIIPDFPMKNMFLIIFHHFPNIFPVFPVFPSTNAITLGYNATGSHAGCTAGLLEDLCDTLGPPSQHGVREIAKCRGQNWSVNVYNHWMSLV